VTVYTLGVWTVKSGREDEFVNGWHALAQWTLEQGFEAHGTLVRDHDDPSRFVSFGPWPNVDQVRRWRADPGFHAYLDEIMKSVERFEPGTYDVVLSVS
jgi:heme-degrading monooxygenase HmoA